MSNLENIRVFTKRKYQLTYYIPEDQEIEPPVTPEEVYNTMLLLFIGMFDSRADYDVHNLPTDDRTQCKIMSGDIFEVWLSSHYSYGFIGVACVKCEGVHESIFSASANYFMSELNKKFPLRRGVNDFGTEMIDARKNFKYY